MKDYKLSEIKKICHDRMTSGENCIGCPLSWQGRKYIRCILEDISKFEEEDEEE